VVVEQQLTSKELNAISYIKTKSLEVYSFSSYMGVKLGLDTVKKKKNLIPHMKR
jgi:hypothetical protein